MSHSGVSDHPTFTDSTPIILELDEPLGRGAANFPAQTGAVIFQNGSGGTATASSSAPEISWTRSTAISQSLIDQLTKNDTRSGPALSLSTLQAGGESELSWTFDPGPAFIDLLGRGERITLTYAISLQDEAGSSSEVPQLLVIHINGTNELISGSEVADTLQGSEISDDIFAFGGSDVLVGNSGTDGLYGGAGADQLEGGSGHDLLEGGEGQDSLIGGYGDDTLKGDAGNDVLTGDSGTDTAVFDGAWSEYAIARTSAGYSFARAGETDESISVERFAFAGAAAVGAGALANHAPSTANDALSADLQGNAQGNVLTNDGDPNAPLGDTLRVIDARSGAATSPGAFSTINGATRIDGIYGVLTIGPDGSAGYDLSEQDPDTVKLTGPATDIFTYRVRDAKGLADSGQITVSVSPPPAAANAPPTAAADLLDAIEDIATSYAAGAVLANDHDGDGDPLSLASVSSRSGGTVSLNSDGTIAFTPVLDFNGVATFDYIVQDARGGTATGAVSINVAAVNDAPSGSATALLADGAKDTDYRVTAADLLQGFTDVDGDTLAVTGLRASDGAVTSNGDGSFTITPSSGYVGRVTLTYDVEDGRGGAVQASRAYQIGTTNQAPTGSATATLPVGIEDRAYQLTATQLLQGFSDPDGDALAVSDLRASDGMVSLGNDGSFTITPSIDHEGPVTLNYDVIDGRGGSVEATLAYNVAPVDDILPHVIYNSDTGALIVRGNLGGDGSVEIVLGDTSLGLATAGGDGSFEIESNVRLDAGNHQLVLRITDAQGGQTSTGFAVAAAPSPGDAWYNNMLDPGARGVALGDSLIEFNSRTPGEGSDVSLLSTQGFLAWATVLDPRWDFTTWLAPDDPNGLVGGNAGKASAHLINDLPTQTVPDIWSARTETAARDADFVIVEGGTNDLNSNRPAAEVKESIQQIVDHVLAEERFVIVSTVPPRILNTDPNAPSRGWPADDPRWDRLDEVNAWIRETYGDNKVHGVILADLAAAVESEGVDGIKPEYTRDGTHFSALGGFTASSVYADAIAQIVKPGVPDSYRAPSLLSMNAHSGTDGVAGPGVTGTVPDDFTFYRGDSFANWSANVETIADIGIRMTFHGGAPAGVDYFDLRLAAAGGTMSIGEEANWVRLYAQVDVEAWQGWQGLSVQIETGDGGSSLALRPLSGTSGRMPEAWDGWLVTPPIFIGHGVGTITPHLQVIVGDASGSGSLTVKSFDLRIVDDPGPAWNYTPQLIRGGAAEDRLEGNSLENTIYGRGAADTILGHAADDMIAGEGGDDQLVGGAGIDTAIFDGQRADFSIEKLGDGTYRVAPLNGSSPAGADILQGIEHISFSSSEMVDLTAGRAIEISGTALAAYSAPGTVIGNLRETLDGAALPAVTWRLEDDASGRFALSGSDLVAGKVRVDDTVAPQHEIVVIGTAADGLEIRATIRIMVTPEPGTTLTGTDAGELLNGTNGKDMLAGAGGDDVLVPHGRADTLDGGAGIDLVSYQDDIALGATKGISLTVTGAGAAKITDGWGDADTFVNVERVAGTSAADRFVGIAGVPIIFHGLAGDDYFFGGSGGASATVSYALDAGIASEEGDFGGGGVTVDLLGGYAIDGYGGRDQLVSIPHAIGTDQNDWINGNNSANILQAGSGDDLLSGGGGSDTLSAGGGNDTLLGGVGNNILDGGDGIDTANFSDASSAVTANLAKLGLQTVFGTTKDSFVAVENLSGSSFDDVLTGDGGDNLIAGANGADSLVGGAGADDLRGDAGHDSLYGGDGDDRLDGGSEDDRLEGGMGADHYVVDDADDLVIEVAGGGADTVTTGLASYILPAEVENLIHAGGGDFTGTGNALDNQISGSDHDDALFGGDGNDVLAGLLGSDTLDGGMGTDSALFPGAWTDYRISAATGGYTFARSGAVVTASNVESFVFGDAAALPEDVVVDDAPVAADDLVRASADGFATGNSLANDTDEDTALGDFLTLSSVGAGSTNEPGVVAFEAVPATLAGTYGSLTIGTDGSFSYDIDESDPDTAALTGAASDVFTYRVVDAKGLSTLARLTIDLPAPAGTGNLAPVAVGDELAATEDSPAAYRPDQLLANDRDDNHDPLRVASVTNGTGGAVVMDQAGNIVFTPAPDFNGEAGFAYVVEDGKGGTATGAVSVAVAAVNDAASIGGGASGVVTEDGQLTASGVLQVSDVDAGENRLAAPGSVEGAYGLFSVDPVTGEWSYRLANSSPAVQSLDAGQVVHDTLRLFSADGTAQVFLDVAVNGANEQLNHIVGDSADNELSGTGGNDHIDGAGGDDRLSGLEGENQLDGGSGADTASYAWSSVAVTLDLVAGTASVAGGIATDRLISIENVVGSLGADSLTGDTGANLLDGGEGADLMTGGSGDDAYWVDNADDRVVEMVSEGLDTIMTSLSAYVAPSGIEILSYSGTVSFVGTGNELANSLTGGNGADRLSGAGGGDLLSGGNGNDSLYGTAGNDRLIGGVGADRLYGGIDADIFIFSGLSDSTTLAAGRDIIGDFSPGQGDLIDLSEIDANPLIGGDQAFILSSTLTGIAGQLIAVDNGNGTFAMRGDVDGDRKADFSFYIDNPAPPASDWFIL